MSEPRILIVFTTVDGHTRKVATHLAKTFTEAGHGAVLADLHRVTDPLETEGLDGVILAGPVRFGRHPRRLRRFARRNREALADAESAFVSVSGAAMADDPEAEEQARGYVEKFLDRTAWEPDRTLCVGGALAYTQYNALLRRVMRSIGEKAGLSTDTSRDHEYTDWDALDAFAADFGQLVAKRRAARPGPGGRPPADRPGGPGRAPGRPST